MKPLTPIYKHRDLQVYEIEYMQISFPCNLRNSSWLMYFYKITNKINNLEKCIKTTISIKSMTYRVL